MLDNVCFVIHVLCIYNVYMHVYEIWLESKLPYVTLNNFHRNPTFEDSFATTQSTNNKYYDDVVSVNVYSSEFDCLPPEVQHEILLERQMIEKYSYHDPDTLPQVSVWCGRDVSKGV